MAKWLDKYEQGGLVLKQKTKDNYGKQGNYNDAKVSTPPGYVGLGYDTKGRNYSPAWGGQFAMGGSIPGAVGFTYARVAGSAPSNGKYAKKTLASAQDGVDLQKAWLTSYLQSPKYKERLGKEFAGQSDEFIQQENDARLNNLLNEKIKYVRSIGSSPGWYAGMMIPKEHKGQVYDHVTKKFIKHEWSPDAKGIDKKGTVYLENEYRPGHWNPSEGFETVPLHELGHAVDDGGYRIPASTEKKIHNYTDWHQFSKDLNMPNYKNNGLTFDYYNTPSEFINRLQPIRYLLNKEGLHDARTSDFTEKDYDNMLKNKKINNDQHYIDLMKSLKGDKKQKKKAFVDLMNTVAKIDDNENVDVDAAQNGKEMKFYQQGLDFTPKTISKNGSVIKDDMGQWAHPGEITEINSNNITMEGVDYPVLGVSDTGDTKMMQPGKNYKFMGKKVTEFPMAQSGKKLTAKQIKQNEEFLQSQKSFYDYLTQNDRQDYPIDYTNQYPALKSDATRNVIPRKMTDKEKLEAVAIYDQAQKRALNTNKEIIAERKRNASQKGDLNTPGSWHTEDKGRLFPESVGGLGEMYDDYLNPLTIVGSLADAAGESIVGRDPKSLALTLGMAGGLGALGFSPLHDAIALKGGVDNLFNKGVSSLASNLRRPGTPLNTYYDDLVPQLGLPTTERMALPSTQRMGLPYTQQLGLPQPALQQAISRAAQNLGRVPYQEPTAAELAEMNLREATRYAPRVDRTGRQRMGNPDDMRALYNPPAQQATIPFGETQPVDYDDFDWVVRPDEIERFRARLAQSEQRQLARNMYDDIFGNEEIARDSRDLGTNSFNRYTRDDIPQPGSYAPINVPTQRIPDYDDDGDMVAAFMSRPQAQRIPDPSTYTNRAVDMTPEEIAMSNATSTTGAPATSAPTAVNPQSSFIQKGYALNSEPVGSYQTVDPTSGNKIDYDINESERDGIRGTYGDYTMRDDNDGYFHFGLFKPNDPNEYARISPGMTFRNEGPGATKQLQMMMSRLPKKVEVPHISTSIYSTPLMDSHFSRISQNQPGRLTLKNIRLSPLNDWKREQDGKSYIDQIIDQFPKLQKWSKKLGENTGYQLPEPVINLGSNPVTVDELKAIQNNKGNYSPEDWYDLTERLHVLAPKYTVKKHWRNGGSSNWLDKYK